MPACGSNALTPRLRRAIGYSVGTSAEMRGDICSIERTSSAVPKDSAGLRCQRESCKMHMRQALVPARGRTSGPNVRSGTSWPVALPERSSAALRQRAVRATWPSARLSAQRNVRTDAHSCARNGNQCGVHANAGEGICAVDEYGKMIPWGHSDEQEKECKQRREPSDDIRQCADGRRG